MRRRAISVLGVGVVIDALSDHAEALINALDRRVVFDEGSRPPELFYELRDGDMLEVITRASDGGYELIDTVESIEQASALIANDLHPRIADRVPDLLVLHAGAVAWQGMAIIVPGRSHSGKSRLVAAMLQLGADYLSDEFALLDADGQVHPYPRHLSLRRDDGSTTLVPPQEFGASVHPVSAPLGLVVVTHFRPHARFIPTATDGAQALLPLIDNALVAQTRPKHTMKMIAGLAGQVDVVHSDRGEASDAADAILSYASRLQETSA